MRLRILSALSHAWLGWPPLALLPGAGRYRSPREGGAAKRAAAEPPLAAFFEHSHDPLVVMDAALRVVDANPAAARFLGVSPDTIRETAALEIELLARLLAAASIPQRLRSDPAPVVDEVAVADAEGQSVQCRIEAIPLPDGRTLIHLQDTSAVLRAREALRSAEHLRQAAFEAMREVAWVMALPEERLLDIGPAVERLFGYQPADLKARPELWDELVHPAERERVRDEFRRGLATGHPFEIQFTGLHRDHRDLPHLVNRVVPVVDEHGWSDRCEGFIDDQGARRHTEVALRAAETHLKLLLDSVSSGVLIVAHADDGPQIVLCNRQVADLLRLEQPPRSGLPLSQAPAALRGLVYGPGGEADFAQRLISEDTRDEITELENSTRVLRCYEAPMRDASGEVTGRILTFDDETAAWMLQRRLTQAQKMESMGRLAGGVAHDFYNLLGTIVGFTGLMLEQTPEDDPRREGLLEMTQAGERASRLTKALLTFSRSARFERAPVDLNRVIEDSYQVLRSSLDTSVSVELKLDPALPTILGDALLLQQVVVNLVQEVHERLADGAVLRLVTHAIERPRPSEQQDVAPATERLVAFEIETSATTAPREMTGPRAVSAALDHEGLALTMVEDIARAHGGYLVSGLAAVPALFQVLLPAESPAAAPAVVADEATAHGHEVILVVDDEPGLRALLKSGLRQRGFDVLPVESGAQALEILKKGDPAVDLVILDLSMPGLSGEKVLRAVRGFRPDLPVIIASGYASQESQSSWTTAGAQGFIAKPYRVHDLAQKLREVLDRARGRVG